MVTMGQLTSCVNKNCGRINVNDFFELCRVKFFHFRTGVIFDRMTFAYFCENLNTEEKLSIDAK